MALNFIKAKLVEQILAVVIYLLTDLITTYSEYKSDTNSDEYNYNLVMIIRLHSLDKAKNSKICAPLKAENNLLGLT